MALTYFVTEQYLKTQTGISKNIDATDVMPQVQLAADMYMSIILGRYFYDYILEAFNDETLTPDEETLVEHMKPAIAWRAAERAFAVSKTQFKNKGPQTQNGEFSNTVSSYELDYGRQEYRLPAEFYENRTQKYLKLNKDLFPIYTSKENKLDTPPSHDTNWSYGITPI